MPIRIIKPIFTFRRTQDQASSWEAFVEHLDGFNAEKAWLSVVDAWRDGTLLRWLDGQHLGNKVDSVKAIPLAKGSDISFEQHDVLAHALFGGTLPDVVGKVLEEEKRKSLLMKDAKLQEEERKKEEERRRQEESRQKEQMRLEEERRREEQRRHGMAIPGEDWTAILPKGVKLEMVWVEQADRLSKIAKDTLKRHVEEGDCESELDANRKKEETNDRRASE